MWVARDRYVLACKGTYFIPRVILIRGGRMVKIGLPLTPNGWSFRVKVILRFDETQEEDVWIMDRALLSS